VAGETRSVSNPVSLDIPPMIDFRFGDTSADCYQVLYRVALKKKNSADALTYMTRFEELYRNMNGASRGADVACELADLIGSLGDQRKARQIIAARVKMINEQLAMADPDSSSFTGLTKIANWYLDHKMKSE